MSYRSSDRSSDVYSRRPDDDRRPSDTRDRRRESYGRSFDSYDRQRDRGRDDSPPKERERERGSGYDRPRDSTKSPHTSSRYDVAASRGTKFSSASGSPMIVDSSTGPEALGKAFGCFIEKFEPILLERAKLSWHKDQLMKVQKQRKAEYQKTVNRHADFPSIPELQNKYRARDDGALESIKFFEEKLTQKLAVAQESLISDLTLAASFGDLHGRSDPKDVSAHPSVKQLESDLAALKDVVRQQQDNSKALQARVDELEGRNTERRKNYKEDREEIKQVFEEQIRKLREEFNAEQASAVQAQESKFKQELLQRDATINRLLEKQHQELAKISDKATASEVATLRQENATLRSENVSLRSEVLETAKRVEELAEKLERQVQDVKNLRESITTCLQQVEDQRRNVNDHQNKLMHFETQLWDEMAETYSFAFPRLQESVEKLQSDVGRLNQSHLLLTGRKGSETGSPAPSIALEQYEKKAEEFNMKVVEKVGRWVDDLRARISSLDEQTAALRVQVTSLENATPGDRPHDPQQDYAELQKQLSLTEAEVRKISEDVAQKTYFLNHQFAILQGQYNNLTTKELAQLVLGQLEQIYPDSRKIVADISQLNETTEQIKKEQAEQVVEVKATKEVLTELKRQISDMNSYVEDSADRFSSKKRKLEDSQSPNGIGGCPKVNGVHSVNGSRLSTTR